MNEASMTIIIKSKQSKTQFAISYIEREMEFLANAVVHTDTHTYKRRIKNTVEQKRIFYKYYIELNRRKE